VKRKLFPVILCLALLASVFSIFTGSVAAASSLPPLEVYLQSGNAGTPVPVHTYTQADMQALASPESLYYSGLDSMPSVIQGKGSGVLLSALIEDLQTYNSSVAFGPGAAIKLNATDSYSATYTYEYLLGAKRYCYPDFTDVYRPDTDNAVAIEPMFAVTSIQARNVTRAQLDARTMDASESYRFCYGLLPSDAANMTVTVNKFAKWVNRIYIILPGGSTTPTPSQAAFTQYANPLTNTPATAPAPAKSTNWGLIIGIVAACVVIGVPLWIIVMRQRAVKHS
jgi:hypothetical protein